MRALLLISLFIIAGCASEPRTPPPQNSTAPVTRASPAPAPAPTVVADWVDAPLSAGDWVYRRDERGGIALFGQPGSDAVLTIRCVIAERRMFISRRAQDGAAPTPALNMTLRASSALKTYPAAVTPPPVYVAIELSARDPQLDAIAFSRGRFMISVPGHADVIAPAWAEVSRVIEDCR